MGGREPVYDPKPTDNGLVVGSRTQLSRSDKFIADDPHLASLHRATTLAVEIERGCRGR